MQIYIQFQAFFTTILFISVGFIIRSACPQAYLFLHILIFFPLIV